MSRNYHQYCPIAHALDLVGERWSLLVVRELVGQGPLRYSDLHARLDGCGTNILAARLKALEAGGVVRRRKLPPPAAATVYELTEYGLELRPVLSLLAHWGARSLGAPTPGEERHEGWLAGALRTAVAPHASRSSIEFRMGEEVAALVEGSVVDGAAEMPDAVVTGDAAAFYCLMVDRDLSSVEIAGDGRAVEALLAALPGTPTAGPVVPR